MRRSGCGTGDGVGDLEAAKGGAARVPGLRLREHGRGGGDGAAGESQGASEGAAGEREIAGDVDGLIGSVIADELGAIGRAADGEFGKPDGAREHGVGDGAGVGLCDNGLSAGGAVVRQEISAAPGYIGKIREEQNARPSGGAVGVSNGSIIAVHAAAICATYDD